MRKRLLTMLFATALIGTCVNFPIEVRAEKVVQVADIADTQDNLSEQVNLLDQMSSISGENANWSFDEETGALIISGSGAVKMDIRIPWGPVRKVVVNEGITTLEYSFFDYYSELTEVILPESLETIGEGVFANCEGIANIDLPSGLKCIEERAFAGCSGLTSINIPESVTSIEQSAFQDCSSLNSVVLSNGVKSIEEWVFCGCSSLTSVKLPSSTTSIEYGAFMDCISLTSIDLPESLTSIGESAFSDCWELASLRIPNGVTTIGDRAFSACGKLILYGDEGSYAHTYAIAENIPFNGPTDDMTYTLIFDANGGNGLTMASKLIWSRGYLGELPTVTREGYQFLGWYTLPDDEGGVRMEEQNFIWIIGDEYEIVYARWEKLEGSEDADSNVDASQSFTIIFDTNGGDEVSELAKVVESGNTIGEMPIAKRSGYIFRGWYTSANGGSEVVSTMPVSKSMILYARWEEDTLNNSVNNNSSAKTDLTNASVTFASATCTYTGQLQTTSITSVKLGTTALKQGTDYTVSYANNTNIGTATVTITGIGNYTGTFKATFSIVAPKGTAYTVGACKYNVISTDEVAFTGLANNKTKKVVIPKTVKIGGSTFKVTSIAAKSLRGKSKITSVVIGANVNSIGASAFEGCKKLSKITIKSTGLKKVGKKAFKGIKANAKIKVPKKKLAAYKKLLKNKGQGKKVKISK